MPWYSGVWPAVAAVIAGAFGLYRTSQLRDSRRAAELRDLDQAITTAKARGDPLEHSYRAVALSRMQSHYGDPGSAGFLSLMLWGLVLLFMVGLVLSKDPAWWWPVSMVVGIIGIGRLAGSTMVAWSHGTRMLEAETSQAHEQELALARKAFIDAPRQSDPRKPLPSLQGEVTTWWKKKNASDRLFLKIGAGAAVTFVAGLVLADKLVDTWAEAERLLATTSWIASISMAVVVSAFTLYTRWTPRPASKWLWFTMQVIVNAALSTLVILFGRPWVNAEFSSQVQNSEPPMTLGDVTAYLTSLSLACVLLVISLVVLVVVAKRREARTKANPAASQ